MFTQYCRVGTAPTSQGEVYQRDLVKTGPCCHRWIDPSKFDTLFVLFGIFVGLLIVGVSMCLTPLPALGMLFLLWDYPGYKGFYLVLLYLVLSSIGILERCAHF